MKRLYGCKVYLYLLLEVSSESVCGKCFKEIEWLDKVNDRFHLEFLCQYALSCDYVWI
jgi:hypothetical protein